EACAPREVAVAAEHLCALSGLRECHVVGHCSGSYNAFRAAVAGATIAQVVQVNPLVFSTLDLGWLAGTGAEPVSRRPAAPTTRLGQWRQRVRHLAAKR